MAAAAAVVSASRTVGFRYVALVTGNDTDAAYVARARSLEGTSAHGMYLRVNGVVLWARGANVIPMEELEGRLSARTHVASAPAPDKHWRGVAQAPEWRHVVFTQPYNVGALECSGKPRLEDWGQWRDVILPLQQHAQDTG